MVWSQDFEWSTAAALAADGFFVVVYDQRGQGRSKPATDPKDYSYQKYADDIKILITQLNLKQPTLIGHSHGPNSMVKDHANYIFGIYGSEDGLFTSDTPTNWSFHEQHGTR
jgi:pimeloyl-ACP methyl ester carboxylesterase